MIKFEDLDFYNILIDEKSYGNILIYGILFGKKSLRIRFEKVDRIIRAYAGTRYLVFFGPEKYDSIYNRISYLISQKSGITFAFSHDYAKAQIYSNYPLPLKKYLLSITL